MKRLPPILVQTEKPWRSSGPDRKPTACESCSFSYYSSGFLGDYNSGLAKAALVFRTPSKDEVNEKTALAGAKGYWFLKNFIEPLGWKKSDLLVSHVLRCYPPYKKLNNGYPTGFVKKQAEGVCRQYDRLQFEKGEQKDGGIVTFCPNLFLITFDIDDILSAPSFYRQVKLDMEKCKRFVDAGYKPVVLFGTEAAALIAPYVEGSGGAKGWRGHFGEIEGWPFSGLVGPQFKA